MKKTIILILIVLVILACVVSAFAATISADEPNVATSTMPPVIGPKKTVFADSTTFMSASINHPDWIGDKDESICSHMLLISFVKSLLKCEYK